MNRKIPPVPERPTVLIEALEPRIAPAGLLNESKFTSVAVGGTLLLDASGAPGTYQGLTTGSGGGSGSYLLYLATGRALVFTTDLNGNGILDPGEITGIALGKDSLGRAPSLILFSDVNGDIATDLQGTSGASLTDSDHNPNNGRDGQLLTDTDIASITLRTLTASDLDPTIPGNTVNARLALTSFSIHGNIAAGGNVDSVSIDTSGAALLTAKFNGSAGDQLFTGATPNIGGIFTGTATNNLAFHFTQNNPSVPQVEGTFQGFRPPAGEHGGDILNVGATDSTTVYSIGVLAAGDGGTGARGGNLNGITMHGDTGGYELIAGNGGDGSIGGQGGSILAFNDLGTVTGEAILHTGDGGTGLLGAGGAGGLATFATTHVAADVQVLMGHGGDGFSGGGAGASFTSGDFVTPETVIPVGSKFLGTWHNIGDVGNTHPLADGTYSPEAINFNDPSFFSNAGDATAHGDTSGDGVFTTSAPDQVVVVFGNGFGGLLDNDGNYNGTASATVVLKVPGVTNPVVTVGDFNGDGRPDIAVASGNANNFNGIYVFLDQIGTALDPINGNNFTHSLVGDHPFSAAHQTALPTLADQGYYQTSGAVVALAAGDYNGDGLTDIAYVQNVTQEGNFDKAQTVGVLLGDGVIDPTTQTQQHNTTTGKLVGSGYFYANAGTARSAPALLNTIITPGTITLEATSLTNTNLPSVATGLPAQAEEFLLGAQGADHITAYSLLVNTATHVPLANLLSITLGLGQVDTNRNLGGTNISLTQASLQGFTIQDVNNSGTADVVALSKTPSNFLVDFSGDGNGGFSIQSGGGDNAGLFLGTGSVGIAIAAADTNTLAAHVGTFDTVAVLELPSTPGPVISEFLLHIADGTPSFYYNNGGPTSGRTFVLDSSVQDQTVLSPLDAYYAIAPTQPTATNAGANPHPDTGYGVLTPESSTYFYTDLSIFTAPDNATALDSFAPRFIRYLTENGYVIHAGGGGNSTVGIGGAGGTVGAITNGVATGTGAVNVVFPVSQTFEGQAFLQGGSGGNGTGGGGIGGDITGITVSYAAGAGTLTSGVQIAAGNGGNGISGDGGRGGNLSQLSISTGTFFSAGNAGSGLHGGQGGSIAGNAAGVYDTFTSNVQLITGIGGEGALQGGAGGNISNWNSEIADFVGRGGSLAYTTGAGGGAAGGVGGNGGSILNSSPDQNQNNLSGPLTLQTGAGGSGLAGGNGGAINTFINQSSDQSAVPTTLTVLTGNGGVGVSQPGGTGGAITNFSSNATGLSSFSGEALTGIGRIIAGDGGVSYGGQGGIGGSLTKITATATSTPLVVAAGAGGDGLTIGGAGGSVTNSTINSAALQIGKMLVVGGKGGNALAAQPQDITLPGDADTNDLAHTVLAFGGAQGMAGNGGNISGIIQPVGAQTAVDLIAGNGGNTPNASTALTATTGVGVGGSVTNVTLTGTVGAISRDTTLGASTNPPIKSYSFTDATGATNTSISAFVDFLAAAGNPSDPLYFTSQNFVLDDSVGNVGIVAGAAGTVRPGTVTGIPQPAQNGVNGDVTGITAASIMSIVAGSVNSVAPVRILSGITITNTDGVLGADKSPNAPYGPDGLLEYLNNTTGAIDSNLQAGDQLIDGALFASQIQQTTGTLLRGPRVFPATSS